MKIRNENRETSGIAWHNVNYESKKALIDNYKADIRRLNDGRYEFSDYSSNHLNSFRDRLSCYFKQLMYTFGFYR